MDKQYKPQQFEDKIYAAWEKADAFKPREKGETFTIIMPPPNANDPLHIGHAMFVTVEDILSRYQRMQGKSVLWLPGTDHAGIETQYVFEKKLAKKGQSRFDFDRSTLYKMIWDYVEENSGVAIGQMKKLGASADWSRTKYTLDEKVVDFVTDTFIKMHKEGLVYRDLKLVNFCTKCGTAFSNLEVVHVERPDKLYYVKYKLVDEPGYVTVATTRPEPIFIDTHLAVNPKDKKNKSLIGKKVANPLTGKTMEIIGEDFVDPKFGTGVVKMTPAHDQTDFEVAKKRKLPIIQAIGQDGKVMASGGELAGLRVKAAREKAVEILEAKGLMEKIDDNYVHSIATCYRCGTIIEPLPSKQFFIKVKPLVEIALKALKDKKVKIMGNGHDKILKHWLTNLEDWNISRQIVWGIRMPVWYPSSSTPNGASKKDYVVSKKSPGKDYTQEVDTFDTWFSSSQWPVVTLETGEKKDLERFYPTQVLETAYDILPFWVMRMLMMGLYLTGKVPFETVYLHGLIRDEKGQKMSKSKGNVINPLVLVSEFGADALRMALVIRSTPGNDKGVGVNDVRAMRNLTNKIWNASRFVIEFLAESKAKKTDEKLLAETKTRVDKVGDNLDKMKVGLAAEEAYGHFWHWFCDVKIEEAKAGKWSKQAMKEALKMMLVMLHPFVPFVTEAVWQELGDKKDKLLINCLWPKTN